MKTSIHSIKRGGGGEYPTYKIFKPLVASSLALALGASVAVAQDPTFTYTTDSNGTQQNVSLENVKDNASSGSTNLHWDNSADGYLFLKADSNTTVKGIELNFNVASTLWAGGTFTAGIKSASLKNVTFTNDSGKGLKLGDSGTGTFKIQLADTFKDSTTKPTINLNFNSTTDNIALYGNLEISGGSSTEVASSPWSTQIKFGGDLKGNLSITNYANHFSKNEITFNNAGKLDGDLYNEGILTLKFVENGGITGDIKSEQSLYSGYLYGPDVKSNITFQKGGVIGGDIAANGQALNSFVLEGVDSTLTVNGNITVTKTAKGEGENKFEFKDNGATLILKGSTNQISTLTAISSGGSNTLALGNSDSGVNANIATITNGNNLNVAFITDANNTLTLNTSDSQLKSIDTTSGSGTIQLASAVTSLTVGTTPISVGSGKTLNFVIDNRTTDLTLKSGIDATNAISLLTINGTGSQAVIAEKELTNIGVNFAGTSSTLTLKGSTNTIKNITANATTSSTLTLDASANAVTATIGSVGGNLGVTMKGSSNSATLNLNGGEITSVTSSGDATHNIINFNSGTTTIKGFSASSTNNGLSLNLDGGNLSLKSITADGTTSGSNNSASVNVTVGNNSTLLLDGANKINSLSGNGGIIDFVGTASGASSIGTISNASSKTFSARSTLTTKTFSGDLNAIVYASKTSADQIIVTDTNSNSSGTLTILAQGDIHEILSITQADEVVVAQVKDSGVKVQGGESVIDGMVLDLSVVQKDGSGSGGNGTTTEYIIGKSVNKGIENSIQEVTNTALTVNYDLFLANFNSLNKRMGELRDNPYSQGVWSRVFGGAMSNEFGSGSKTEYVTLQAGYDYSLALGDARNYMGIALAYGSSWTKANDGIGATTSSLSNVNSSMVEVGIYNSYVMDSGWYNDTIFKFDYIMSDFTLTAGSNTSDNSTNNFAIILSDEFGYRYKFGGDKSWYIDPQVEVGFGYFNQSDFNHALNATTTMTATQDTILTLRTRAGASLGKKFTAQKGFASVYVGAFYEYDYINGGDAETTLSGGLVGNQLNNLKSNGRAIVNIGSNIELSEGVRMYIDVEKSFGNKQRVDMQFNFGARYSFGERATTISYKEQNSNRIPLKIQNQ